MFFFCNNRIIGSGVSFLLALGNGLFQKSILEPIVGLASVAALVFVPYFYKHANFVFDTDLGEATHEHSTYSELVGMMLIFGVLLVIIQLKNLVTICYGKGDNLKKNPAFVFMESVLGSSVNRAYRSKQAAVYKINEMARNAYELHQMDVKAAERTELKREVSNQGSGSQTAMAASSSSLNAEERQKAALGGKSSREVALQKYNDLADEHEEVGGVLWAWKEYISGNLATTEGVWLPSRLLAANGILFVTIIVVLYICTILFTGVIWEVESIFNAAKLNEVQYNDECFSEFDYNDCYFPFEEASYYTGVAVCRNVALSGPGCRDLFEQVSPESTFGSAIGNICDSFNAAFAPFEKQVGDLLGGASCPYVLGAAKEKIVEALAPSFSAADAETIYNACYRVTYMGDEDIKKYNEWFDDDTYYPDITEQTLVDCETLSSFISNETFVDTYQGREDAAYEGFQICMEIYKSLTPRAFCEEPLFYPVEEIITYEVNRTDTDFCYSYLSLCVADEYNPSRGTCIIGEADNR